MINKRLIFELERRKLLSVKQFGFRRARSTADSLNIVETEIQKAFAKREHLVAIALDLTAHGEGTYLILCNNGTLVEN